MQEKVVVLAVLVTMLATFGFATTNNLIPVPALDPVTRPARPPAVRIPDHDNTSRPVVHWDRFYDTNGNPVSTDPQDNVGADSLFFKRYSVTDTLYGCPKSQVPNPSPTACRTGFAFLDGQTRIGMDPAGTYLYEVNGTSLCRHNTSTGTYVYFTITNGNSACRTDGNYLYVPVGDVVYRYTLTGSLVSQTTLNITPNQWNFSLANDTVWCGTDSILHGYACSRFTGGSISEDATWNVGTGSSAPAFVTWDGQYYYVAWSGFSSNTFKRFNANRTLSASGTVSTDPRGLMCTVRGTRPTTQDSLYWKLFSSATNLYSSPKAESVTAAQPTPFAWQYTQAVSCMTPDGHYVFEVNGTNMRRTDLMTGAVNNYTLADASGGACGTDGEYVYVPNGTTTRKYSLTGTLVSSTTTDYAPAVGVSTFCFGVANDTVWISPTLPGATWYGYACSKFTGGSITHDATWSTGGVQNSAMTVTWDGRHYYMVWGGQGTNTFKRFYRDRTLFSDGTVTGDARSVMCRKGDYAVMVCHGEPDTANVTSFRQLLVDSGGTRFAAVDTYDISTGGHAAFPATDWYNQGYRAILTFTNDNPADSAALGDSLARFVQLGGGVVEAVFADQTDNCITGDWRSGFAPFTVQSTEYSAGSMGTVHQPLHPIMSGVTELATDNYRTGNTPGTLRSPNCISLAEYTDANRCLATCFDSAGRRAASLGMFPLTYCYTTITGQWLRLLVNAINWVAVGPSIGVTAPNGGETWNGGSVHNITWTQTDNGVSDSIYYSTDGGASWIGVAHYPTPPDPLQHAWTVPNTPTTQGRVKVVTWDENGGRVEDISDADFTIPAVGIEQPRKDALPLAFALFQPYPNPSASGAQVRYALPRPARVELHVYDVTGALVRRLVESTQPAGYRRAYWNGCDDRGRTAAPGVYYCRFKAGDFQTTQKMVVRR